MSTDKQQTCEDEASAHLGSIVWGQGEGEDVVQG